MPCSVSSHVLALTPLDTCQKNTLPKQLDIGQFIALFGYSTFKWLPLLHWVIGFLVITD